MEHVENLILILPGEGRQEEGDAGALVPLGYPAAPVAQARVALGAIGTVTPPLVRDANAGEGGEEGEEGEEGDDGLADGDEGGEEEEEEDEDDEHSVSSQQGGTHELDAQEDDSVLANPNPSAASAAPLPPELLALQAEVGEMRQQLAAIQQGQQLLLSLLRQQPPQAQQPPPPQAQQQQPAPPQAQQQQPVPPQQQQTVQCSFLSTTIPRSLKTYFPIASTGLTLLHDHLEWNLFQKSSTYGPVEYHPRAEATISASSTC